MLSNQMRGRAIRIDKNNPDKVSNIWHLATVDVPDKNDYPIFGIVSDIDIENLRLYTYDLDQLETRFKGFEAPSYYGKHEIESGIERIMGSPNAMPLPEAARLKEKLTRIKNITAMLASDREQIRQWWKEALYLGYNHKNTKLSTGVKVPKMTTKTLLYTGYKYIIITFLTAAFFAYYLLMQIFPPVFFTILMLLVSAIFFGVIGVKYLRTGTVEGVLKQIAIALLETMSSQGIIKSSVKNVGLHVTEDNGMFFVSCCNLPTEENNMFIQSLQELLDPVGNPRYLLVKHNKSLGKTKQTDYFSVPAVLSARRKSVDMFKKLWEKYIGECEVVYTRNLDGRKMLLKARKDAFSAWKREKSKRLSKWQ